jgi:phosphotransferase system enzyme I (PtsP)
MTIAEKLSELVAHARSVDELIAAAVRMVATELRADTCSLFLLEPDGHLELRATVGDPSHAAAAQVAAEGLAGVAMTQMLPETQESSRSLLAVPMALRGRPIGAIVLQASRRPPYTAAEIETLFVVAAQMVAIVATQVHTTAKPAAPRRSREGEQVFRGVAVSPGVAVGEAAFRGAIPRHPIVASTGLDDERARLHDAFTKTRNDLVHIQEDAARDLGEEHAFIFASHMAMLADPLLHDRMELAVTTGRSAPEAIDSALLEVANGLRASDDAYLQERAEDIEDLRARLLGHLIPHEASSSSRGQIVISPRIAPSLVMEMKAQATRGIVAQRGGATSHGALLARSLEIPAVAGVDDLVDAIDVGDVVVIDGSEGIVIVRPTASTLTRYEARARQQAEQRTEFAKYRDRPATTADGVRISLLANISFGADVALAKENGAEGIGLYRTEFPFIARAGFPTRDEQVRIYRKAYEAFPEHPVTLRILDLAGDKFVSGRAAASRSAFHGYRSIRVLFDYPHVLRDQAQAFALAAGGRPVRVLVPMVSSVDELLRIQDMAWGALHDMKCELRFGAMIEVPAAIEIMRDLAAHIDFFSIGTNDLIQYALVIDREDARMSSPNDAYHPAVLRMIRRAIVAAHAARKPVTICGEMATRPDLALALIALGADGLSVTPAAIPALKQAFASTKLRPLMRAIDHVLDDSADAGTLRNALGAMLDSDVGQRGRDSSRRIARPQGVLH